MNQMAQCSCCPHQYHVDLLQIARGLSKWACPACGAVTDFAERQIQKPDTSVDEQQAWAAVGIAALIIGLAFFADRVKKWA